MASKRRIPSGTSPVKGTRDDARRNDKSRGSRGGPTMGLCISDLM
jgi:hypothetical protein